MAKATNGISVNEDLQAQMELARKAGAQHLAAPEIEVGDGGHNRSALGWRCMKDAGMSNKEFHIRWGNPSNASALIAGGCIPVPDVATGEQVRSGDKALLFAEPSELRRRRIAASERLGNLHQNDADSADLNAQLGAVDAGAGVDVSSKKTKIAAKDLAGAASTADPSD